jgi:5-methylcytosine-specific restriction endonuclease McrA
MALRERTARDSDPKFWEVALRDHDKCVYCGLDGSQDVRILCNLQQLDHLIPKRANGSDSIDNLVLCCSCCNRDKGQWDPSEGTTDLPPREILIEKARQYIETQRGSYYFELYKTLSSKWPTTSF